MILISKPASVVIKHLKLVMLLIILAVFAVIYLDKPLSLWLHGHLQQSIVHVSTLKGSNWLYDVATSELSLIIFVGVVLWAVAVDSRSTMSKKLLLFFIIYQGLCLIFLNFIKGILKYFFGRCVPDVCFLPWYVGQSNQYGFAWFSHISGFASFPSGHCTFMSFCLFWVIVLRSRFRSLVGSLFVLLFGGLVLFNYHFLGDCLAGSALGIFFAGGSYLLWCCATHVYKFRVDLK